MKKCSYATLIFLLAAGGACMAQSDQPTLGDLAKKHRQEEKDVAKVKVLTNDDVASATPSEPVRSAPDARTSTASPSSSAAATAKSSDKSKEADKSPAATKESPEVAQLKQKLNSYKEEQEGWKRTAKKYEDLLATETSDFRRQMYEDSLQGDKQNIEVFQRKIDQTQDELAKAEKAATSNK
jgi:hypothetical protein